MINQAAHVPKETDLSHTRSLEKVNTFGAGQSHVHDEIHPNSSSMTR